MEAATAAADTKDQTEVAETEPATKTPAQLFRFSAWVHVGAGAEGCEDAETGACGDPGHFHAWCRVPNQFQIAEVREKALAAKARKTRQLRDPETDGYTILEDDLDQLAGRGDDAKPEVVDELLRPDWWKDYQEASSDVQEQEDEQGDVPYERIEQDQRRLAELEQLPEEQRDGDEYAELSRHVTRYGELVHERFEALTAPKREALTARDVNDLVDELRATRIRAAAMQEFMRVYQAWSWFVGTLRMPGGPQRFESIDHMKGAADEILAALGQTFAEFEQEASGNS